MRISALPSLKASLVVALILIVGLPALACMCVPIGINNRPVDMHLTEQRAFIYARDGNEHLILSVKYDGGTSQFAWVIPTESRPTVEVQKGAPFHELWHLTEIRMPTASNARPGASAQGAMAAPPPVTVLERKVEGPYELVVLQATESGGLYDWLKKNGFALTPGARGALDWYVKRGWYFAAARIRPGGADNTSIQQNLKAGTIAALHLTYKAKALSYPLRVTVGNPGASKMEVFVVGEGIRPPSMMSTLRVQMIPSGTDAFTLQGPPGLVASGGSFPTLRSLLPQGGTLYKFSGVLNTAQRNQDMIFRSIASR